MKQGRKPQTVHIVQVGGLAASAAVGRVLLPDRYLGEADIFRYINESSGKSARPTAIIVNQNKKAMAAAMPKHEAGFQTASNPVHKRSPKPTNQAAPVQT
ncbi:hypothetical protein ACM67C_05435 [Bergeriella denitrificans]|uniref:hypothetical protein n=1 Tax=Bergeriella denitrificans TaxID=494 RepID=UPI000E1BE4D7|nr:hypothetical protein [Bergeriella denitrificans]